MAPVRFLQWNSNSVRAKKHELITIINLHEPVVIAISETWLRPDTPFGISGFTCLRDDRSDGFAGCAILIRNLTPFSLIPLPPHSQQLNVVAIRAFDISFVSLYIPHPSTSLISELRSIISSIPGPVLVMGDFNAHHILWGCYYCDGFSPLLVDMIDDVNLCIVNDGSPTRRVNPNQNPKTAVDLSLCSPSLASQLSWNVLPSSYGSDHFPILLSLNNRHMSPPAFKPLLPYNLKKANWLDFSSSVDDMIESLPDSIDDENVILCYEEFLLALLTSADLHIPKKSSTQNYLPSNPWWDQECTDSVDKRFCAEVSYTVSMTVENFIEYQHSDAKLKKIISKKKKLGWIKFCESVNPRSPPIVVWNSVRRFRRSLNVVQTTSNDPSEWLYNFANKLAPPFVPYHDSFPISTPGVSSDEMDAPFSFDELITALTDLKDSTPGEDGVPYSFIQRLSDKSKMYFLKIINASFDSGKIPESWKSQIVIPILKPGKNPSDPNSYRPIALSSTLAKICEHLLKNRLEWIVESRNILAPSQFGFRKGLSTIDSLSILTTDIRLSFAKGEYLVAVFLDIASAYDNVLLPLLRQKMQQLSIPARLTHFICNLLTSRTVSVRHQLVTVPPRLVWKGLPQGSVLSPLLYSIYTHDLDLSVNNFCNILQYADDIVLYGSSKSVEDITSQINTALHYLDQWLSDHGLSLSVAKSQAVVFSKKRSIPNINIRFMDQYISVVNKVKFLGIFLDNRLNGIAHTEYIINKCEKGINALRALSGVWWGSHPYSQKLLYQALIRSHIDYGFFVLDPCNKAASEKLNKIQYKCLRIILGAMRSSPTNALQVECVDPPYPIRRQFLSDRFVCKLLQLSSHPLVSRLSQLSELVSDNPNISCLLDSFLKFTRLPNPATCFTRNPLYSIPFRALTYSPPILTNLGLVKGSLNTNTEFQSYIHLNWYNHILIYTDASKLTKDGCVGAACWIPKFKITLQFKCPPLTSVFTGEAVAILEAILFARSHDFRQTVIFTDSLSCLLAIKENPFRSRKRYSIILRIREALFSCHREGLSVLLVWIPSHSGIAGNESADSCAKNAIACGTLEHYHNSAQDLLSLANTRLDLSWNNYWKSLKSYKGKFYATIQPDIPRRPWFFNQKFTERRIITTICRLRLGHACTPVHLAKIRVRDHSLCECGLDEGSVSHILFSCPKLLHPIYDVLPHKVPRPLNVQCVLSFVFSPLCTFLCKYIRHNKIKL